MGKETALPKNIRQIGEIQGPEKICLEDYVMTCIRKKETQEKDGYLGIFYGERRQEEDAVYVFIRGILTLPEAEDAKELVQETEKLHQTYFPDWEVQGCCVIGTYPMERMQLVEEQIPGAGALIYHLQEQEETLYWTLEKRYKKIRGYIVFYEQNRPMQQYLAAEFQEASVEKEGLSDRAIKSFREKIQEKSEKKSSQMMKLASSFFVVTVLVIGAVVVTRIDDIRNVRTVFDRDGSTAENEAALPAATDIYGDPDEQPVYSLSEVLVSFPSKEEPASQDTASAVSGTNITSAPDYETASDEQPVSSLSEVLVSSPSEEVPDWQDTVSAAAGSNVTSAMDYETASDEQPGHSLSEELAPSPSEEVPASQDTESVASGANSASVSDSSDALPASAPVRRTQASYTIQVGDTLADICNKYYGNLDKMDEICEANSITNANVIMPGQRLVLP